MHTDLIEYVEKNGKQSLEDWELLAKKFNYTSGNAARHIWRRYNKLGKIEKKIKEDKIVQFEENFQNSTGFLTYKGPKEIKTKEQLFKECKVDESKWNLDKMVCNAWGKEGNQNWQIKAWLSAKRGAELFQDKFLDFLDTYTPKAMPHIANLPLDLSPACLVINKQDEHLNKYDINGNNNIQDRFNNVVSKMEIILKQAQLSNRLEKIVYVIGSDEFNSEWSSMTTKGTPQRNIMDYEDSFDAICNYEIGVINQLRAFCNNLEVLYIQGNHDEFVGWHLSHFLKSHFRECLDVNFEISNIPTKYIRYSNTAMMFNHGDCIKAQKLTNLFAVQFRKEWSMCDNFYIFTGDKHHEKSEDFNGITFYQLPALSTATGKWENKQGHLGSKNELTAFLIEEGKGRTNIFKQPL